MAESEPGTFSKNQETIFEFKYSTTSGISGLRNDQPNGVAVFGQANLQSFQVKNYDLPEKAQTLYK